MKYIYQRRINRLFVFIVQQEPSQTIFMITRRLDSISYMLIVNYSPTRRVAR